MNLDNIRKEIDIIDEKIVELFENRMRLSDDVAAYKAKTNKKILDSKREAEKLNTLKGLVHNEFNINAIEELFKQIMSMSRKLQYAKLGNGINGLPLDPIDKIGISNETKVVYYGMNGAFTEQAMNEYFGLKITSFNKTTFKGVMESIKEGQADYGILPIENSSTGGITDIYDLLIEFDNYIIGEYILKIDQALLGLDGAVLSDIKTVYSHPQGLKQSARFLDEYPAIKRIEYESTAQSAKKVIDDNDKGQGAIASEKAAEYYGLNILKRSINHNETNATRFIIITNKKVFISNATKLSICFELPHESGSLYNMLSHFIHNGLNMTKIESRPIEGRNWEYRFFIDVEGNLKDIGVKNALFGINEEAINMKVLGNY